jgi:ABC-2 type transport system ATP-binding protein
MALMENWAVQITGLNFQYSGQATPCISNLNLNIPRGERFGLFGPNGAGKTTLIQLMIGLLFPKNGHIQLLGHKVQKHKKNINALFGFVPQDLSFYQELSPVENLCFFGALTGLKKKEIKDRTEELLEILGLTAVRNKQTGTFSGGMKRRVNLAIGVIHRPEILFLDEPTVGVDIQTRNAIIGYLKTLNKEGMTLIYNSHQLHEAEELCHKIALIDEGKIIVHDDLQQLLVQHKEQGLEGLFLSLTGKAYRD